MANDLIPIYKKEDFLDGTAPFEFVYKYKDDNFELSRQIEKMADMAKSVGVRNFKTLFNDYCKKMKQINNQIYSGNVTNFDGQEFELETGAWRADDFAISKEGPFGEIVACVHPIMPVKRLVNIDTGIEKLELAYKKSRQWRKMIFERRQLASASSIVGLSDYGVAVTSENAKYLVQYIHDVENLNYDNIPECSSVSRLGWIGDEGFSPYVEDLIFDGDVTFKHFFESVSTRGSEKKWMDAVKKIRISGNIPARIVLAASFASVLVEPCNCLPFFVHLWGGTGTGKAQPLDTKIITPDGYKRMGDIKVGDMVIGQDGKPHRVTGVYPQGAKEVFELTFKDGTKTRCCKEHLWWVTTITRKNHKRGFKVMSLGEMMEKPLKTKGYNLRIPIPEPVQYAACELPIDPYLLGALLGDGCLTLKKNPANYSTNIYFNNSEEDVLERVGGLLGQEGMTLRRNKYTTNQYVITGEGKAKLCDLIRSIGLNVRGEKKFIPDVYRRASVADRIALLCGLMDTDGSVNKVSGSFSYSTESDLLAGDVMQLCQSLGYRATVSTSMRHKEDRTSVEHVVRIWTSDEIFTSNKHRERYRQARESQTGRRNGNDDLPIIDIRPVGTEECQCIMVDSPDHTYLCDDFIVTHNTVGLMLAASVWANPEMGKYIHTFNSTAVAQELSAGFVNSLPLILDELQILKDKKDFDQMIYQLSEGVGRGRGQKSGGLQRTSTWKNCIITTGEQPISSSHSGGGAINRIIEINCEDTKLFDDPIGLVDTVKRNHGHAGKKFIKAISEGDMMDTIKEMQKELYSQLTKTEVTEKQALAASLILAADILIDKIFFRDGLCLDLKDVSRFLSTHSEVSSNIKAYEWLMEWLAQNAQHFDEGNEKFDAWGKFHLGSASIIRSVFNKACSENGFNPTAFLTWLKRNEKLEIQENGKGFTKAMRINKVSCHCVVIKEIERQIAGFEPIDEPWSYTDKS